MAEVRRARPWLGTIVEIRVDGLPMPAALAAIDAAFDEVAMVHRLMSFHDVDSDLSRLHRAAARRAVPVDTRTFEVLSAALGMARASGGRFDPCVAAQLVAWDRLPVPVRSPRAHDGADWRDVRLSDDGRVRFARPLWLDLGGIAKGYAVDRAIAVLAAHAAPAACVNAGGDLRRYGPTAEPVALRWASAGAALPSIELGDAAVASSAGAVGDDPQGSRVRGPHVDGRSRRERGRGRGVSVVASTCVVADALTKVVLADVRTGQRLLRANAATACLYDARRGWRMLGDA